MTHHHLGFHCADSLKCYADYDQDRGTAHGQTAHIRQSPCKEDREDRNQAQEDRTCQSNL